MLVLSVCFVFFFFNDTATTEIYTLSLHDALPISGCVVVIQGGSASERSSWEKRTYLWPGRMNFPRTSPASPASRIDRKSTRLNSSHSQISYAVFCLKKKKIERTLDLHLERSLDHS